MVKELRGEKEKKFLNDLASDLTSADFKPSADQIANKFGNILLNAKKGTKRAKKKTKKKLKQVCHTNHLLKRTY